MLQSGGQPGIRLALHAARGVRAAATKLKSMFSSYGALARNLSRSERFGRSSPPVESFDFGPRYRRPLQQRRSHGSGRPGEQHALPCARVPASCHEAARRPRTATMCRCRRTTCRTFSSPRSSIPCWRAFASIQRRYEQDVGVGCVSPWPLPRQKSRSVLPKRAGVPQIRKAASIKGEARIVNHSSGALDRMVLLRLPAHAKSRGACPCHEVREKIPIATWSSSTWARALTTAAWGRSTPSQNSTVHATESGCRDCSRNGGNLGGNGNSMFFGDARWKRPDFSERILCCRMPLRVAQVSAD